MARFPDSLVHPSGNRLVLDRSRLLLAFRAAQDDVEQIRRKLAALSLALEDQADKAAPRPTQPVNHTDRHFWVRSAAGAEIGDELLAKIEAGFGDELAWLGPVYRLPRLPGRLGLMCPFPNVILVRLRTPTEPEGNAAPLAAMLRRVGVQSPVVEDAGKSRYLSPYRYFVITDPKANNAYALRELLMKQTDGAVAEVRFETMPMLRPTAAVPDDPLFAQQWDMTQIDAPEGWDISTGDAGVVVCVLDEGCDLAHPDLQFSTPGINLGTMMPDGSPTGDHGTACAGIVAATFDNAAGVAGVAGACRIMPLAFQGWTDVEVAAGINYAADNGALVISMSFGWDPWDHAIIDPAIQHAFDTDVVMCVATHNYDGPITYPATNPLVMACGASDQIDNRKSPTSPDGEYWWGSDFGPEMSVVAPGVLIPTTDRLGADGYDNAADYITDFNGTSSATPHVAGLAGLLRSTYPALGNVEVRNIIERSAEKTGVVAYADLPGYPNGSWNEEMGYGRINVYRALDLADVLIRDHGADSGAEPGLPPGGNFWSFSDIVVRIFDDDVFVPGDPAQSKHLELGQTNYLYVRVVNNGPRAARNVVVSARLTPFVGTQFVYPHDWTAVDATHLSPTPITANFAAIAAGGEAMAKFSISVAQVQQLWDENWHPCLVAAVDADNDYAFATAPLGTSPIVVQRNNLAQRNLSVINVLAGARAAFPFLAGHVLNDEGTMHLVVNRARLPKAATVRLALDEGNRHFPQVDLTPPLPAPGRRDGCGGLVFLERTRVRTCFGCCEGVLTLEKGSSFDCMPSGRVGEVDVRGGELILENGLRVVDVRDNLTLIRMQKEPAQMYAFCLYVTLPAGVADGSSHMLSVAQQNALMQTVGGASAVFVVGQR